MPAHLNHPILIAGDPHGRYEDIREACGWHEDPGTLILLGDQNLERPLHQELAPVFDAGWRVLWIIGNHDTDSTECYDNLATDHPGGDISSRVIEVGGIRIAGLGGVFRGRIWNGTNDPIHRTRQDYLKTLERSERWRGGIPLKHRSTIFPEDLEALGRQRCDILVCHEAPSTHLFGVRALDDLADRMGARLIVHGHHHRSYTGNLRSGAAVRGLDVGEVWQVVDPGAQTI